MLTIPQGRIMYAFSQCSVFGLSSFHLWGFQGRNHFINSHGETCVRLAFEQTVHPYTPSLLIVMVAPFLFLDPVALVRELHTIFVDNTPSSERWNAFNLNLNGQLQDSTLLVDSFVHYRTAPATDVEPGYCLTQCQCWVSRYQQR
jgi:hypothetical protein